MTKETLIALGLTEEQADKILVFYSEISKDLVPKIKLTELETENAQLQATIKERDSQLEEIKSTAGDGGDSEELKNLQKQLEEIIAKNAEDKAKLQEEFNRYKKDNVLAQALLKAGAKNPKAVQALLDQNKISLDGENLLGLNDQLEAIKASDAYLFDTSPNLQGYQTGASSDAADPTLPKENPFDKKVDNLTKQAELWKKDKELAKKLAQQAGNVPAWMK